MKMVVDPAVGTRPKLGAAAVRGHVVDERDNPEVAWQRVGVAAAGRRPTLAGLTGSGITGDTVDKSERV